MKKVLQVLNILAFLVMVTVNYTATIGAINGNTMATVSAKFENLFTPAGYAFSIWGIIYLGLFCFVIFQVRNIFSDSNNSDVVKQVGWWFILSCAANVLWIFAWLNEFLGLSVIIMLVLLFSLVKIILHTRMELDDEPLSTIAFIWWPFSLYSGWITVATIANIAAWLTSENWSGFGISEITWTIIMIIVAGGINLLITWTRNMREFALVGAWALAAVAVNNVDQNFSIVLTALLVTGILILSSGIHGYKNREYSPWKKL